jgi:hypothetical protein
MRMLLLNEGLKMLRLLACSLSALMLGAFAPTQASASPSCLRDHKPYKLAGDAIQWSMTIKPGAECIQGLRWSFMQVFTVWVLDKPKSGELVIVGSGFRYFAKPGSSEADKFTLVVVGKNRHDEGYSTVEVSVTHPESPQVGPLSLL